MEPGASSTLQLHTQVPQEEKAKAPIDLHGLMSPRADRAKQGDGVREIPVSETTHPPGDRHCAGRENVAFDGHDDGVPCMLLPWPCRRWEAGGSGKFKGLLKVINQASDRAGIQVQIVSLLNPISCVSRPTGSLSQRRGVRSAPRPSLQCTVISPTRT